MSLLLTPKMQDAFRAEQREKNPRLVRIACALSFMAFVSFALIDPFLVTGEQLSLVFGVRGAIVLLMGALFALTYTNFGKYHINAFAIVACVATGSGVIVLTSLTGGATSAYRDALYMNFLGFALLMPWSAWEASLSMAFLAIFYDVILYVLKESGPLHVMIPNNAVLWYSLMITAIGVAITHRLRMQEFSNRYLLEESNRKLKELDQVKNYFFANISHELRTPLTLILAPLDSVVADESLSINLRHQIDICRRNGVRLLRLIDDLLQISKLESDSLNLNTDKFNLSVMVCNLVDEIKPLAQRRKIHVTTDISHCPIADMVADDHQIERVLLNLIANALKFTGEQGTVHIKVAQENHGKIHGFSVWINDTGQGIPEAALPFVFDRFYQVETDAKKCRGGVGIGLSLCKKIIELHNGYIYASSSFGQGTSMKFWLPSNLDLKINVMATDLKNVISLAERSEQLETDKLHNYLISQDVYRLAMLEDATERRRTPRIQVMSDILVRKFHTSVLVVDDNPDMVEALCVILSENYQVYSAMDGEEALEAAQKYRPDLIVSDYMMPQKNGIELLVSIRNDAYLCETPFVLLTAYGADKKMMPPGVHVDAFVSKPFSSDKLCSTLEDLLHKRK